MPASLTEVNKSSLVQPVLWLKYDLSRQNLALHTKMRQSPQMLKGPFKILPPRAPLHQRNVSLSTDSCERMLLCLAPKPVDASCDDRKATLSLSSLM